MRRAWRSFLAVRFDRFSSYRNVPPDPPTLFTLTRTQWPYQSKIVGADPGCVISKKQQTSSEMLVYRLSERGIKEGREAPKCSLNFVMHTKGMQLR